MKIREEWKANLTISIGLDSLAETIHVRHEYRRGWGTTMSATVHDHIRLENVKMTSSMTSAANKSPTWKDRDVSKCERPLTNIARVGSSAAGKFMRAKHVPV